MLGCLWYGMDTLISCPSSPLVAANRRLHELRSLTQAQRQAADDRHSESQHQCLVQDTIGDCVLTTDDNVSVTELPDHLGWGSGAVTAVLRRRWQGTRLNEEPRDWVVCLQETAVVKSSVTNHNRKGNPSENNPQSDGWVKLYPTIGLGMLRQEIAAPGRLWLMLRYLDREGSGLLRIDNVSKILTKKTSTLHLCGKRQLRNLFQAGEGVCWTRDKEHIWLRSAAKMACALGVDRLIGQPVALPVSSLLGGIGTFRAHLYAAFHSGRTKKTPYGTQAMPIARETLSVISGVGRSSQRAYESRVGVSVNANFAVGDLSEKENQETRAWKHGQALFELKDFYGQQGKKGKTYLAWQLPNNYIGQHQQRPKGRQKRINREIKDLVMKGMPGNVEGTIEAQKPEKVYFPNGKLAAKTYGRGREREMYWHRHRTENGRFDLWQQL